MAAIAPMPFEYVIYARKSSEGDDRQAASIPAQLDELRRLAAHRGVRVAAVYEEARSARTPGRPVFSAVMDRVNRKEIAGVLCWKADRLARNWIDGGRVIDAIDRRVLPEILTPGRTFRDTSDDKLLLGIEFGMSKKYVDDLSENVTRGNNALVASGRIPGRPPLGYLKGPRVDQARGRGAGDVIPDPDRFASVRELFRRFATGAWTVPELHRFATRTLGLTSLGDRRHAPGLIPLGSLYLILKNPFYAGVIARNGNEVPGGHEPIVTPEDFAAVQRALGRGDARRPSRHVFDFTGLLRCGACGRAISAEQHTNRFGRTYVYYRCSRRRVGLAPCRQPYVSELDLRAQLEDLLAQCAVSDAQAASAVTRLEREAQERGKLIAAERRALEAQLATKTRALTNLLDLVAHGTISPEEYTAKRASLTADVDELRARAASMAPGETLNAATIAALGLARTLPDGFREGTVPERRELLARCFAELRLRDRVVEAVPAEPIARIVGTSGALRARPNPEQATIAPLN